MLTSPPPGTGYNVPSVNLTNQTNRITGQGYGTRALQQLQTSPMGQSSTLGQGNSAMLARMPPQLQLMLQALMRGR